MTTEISSTPLHPISFYSRNAQQPQPADSTNASTKNISAFRSRDMNVNRHELSERPKNSAFFVDRASDANEIGINVSTASVSNEAESLFTRDIDFSFFNDFIAMYVAAHTEIYTPTGENAVVTNSIGFSISIKV